MAGPKYNQLTCSEAADGTKTAVAKKRDSDVNSSVYVTEKPSGETYTTIEIQTNGDSRPPITMKQTFAPGQQPKGDDDIVGVATFATKQNCNNMGAHFKLPKLPAP